MPQWLPEHRDLTEIAQGCYRFAPSAFFPFLWIAANELPLADELVPFLVARSGQALDEFGLWVADRRPRSWLRDMVRYTSMSDSVRKEIVWKSLPSDDPKVTARERVILDAVFEIKPSLKQEIIDEGRLEGRLVEARAALRRVLTRRGLPISPKQSARIDACTDLPILERWHEQAITAPTTAKALR